VGKFGTLVGQFFSTQPVNRLKMPWSENGKISRLKSNEGSRNDCKLIPERCYQKEQLVTLKQE